jgi:hypothetical protein
MDVHRSVCVEVWREGESGPDLVRCRRGQFAMTTELSSIQLGGNFILLIVPD